jgi:predicted nucleic acid-binding protein
VRIVFADTFYWAALTSTEDPAHKRAMEISRTLTPDKIITTDEVLCEYLAFFAGARSSVRDQASKNVVELINASTVLVVPQSRESFLAELESFIAHVPTKGIA